MVSAIDPSVIVDAVDVDKADLRAQLALARDEISALQLLQGDTILEGDTTISVGAPGVIDFPSVTMPATLVKGLVAIDTTSLAQTINFLVDDTEFLNFPDNTLLFYLRATSAANALGLTVNVPGQMRSNNHLAPEYHDTAADTVYVGYSLTKSSRFWLPVFKDSGFIFVGGAIRENIADNFEIIPNRVERILSSAANITEEITRRANHNQTVKVESGTHVFNLPSPLSDEDVTMFFWNLAGTLTVGGISVPATKFATMVLLSGDVKVVVEA